MSVENQGCLGTLFLFSTGLYYFLLYHEGLPDDDQCILLLARDRQFKNKRRKQLEFTFYTGALQTIILPEHPAPISQFD